MIDSITGVPYSPVAEAEHAARLDAAARLVADPLLPYRHILNRASAVAVARHLDRALQVIEQTGWTQGLMRDEDGGVCLLKALTLAAGDERVGSYETSTTYVAGTYLDVMVHVVTGQPGWFLGWNDEPGRTRDEALALVREAAEFARTHGPR
jgi:L-fucose isomerase-like protein